MPLHPSSPKGTEPLDLDTDEQVWEAGYEMASYFDTHGLGRRMERPLGREVDVVDLFILAIQKDRRLPRRLSEEHPQFWEYFGVFAEGAKDYAKSRGGQFRVR